VPKVQTNLFDRLEGWNIDVDLQDLQDFVSYNANAIIYLCCKQKISTFNIRIPGGFGDSLTIYDGDSEAAPMFGRYCGNLIPPNHISSNNNMFLHFKTWTFKGDTAQGFKLEYQQGTLSEIKIHMVSDFMK